MMTIDITEHLHADQNAVFNVLTDHAGYTRFPGVVAAELVKPGSSHQNGVGAQRKVSLSNGLTLWEDITEYSPGQSFAYQIVKLRPSVFKHHGGQIDLLTENGKTIARWRSTILVPVPLIGPAIEKKLAKKFGAAFRSVLRSI